MEKNKEVIILEPKEVKSGEQQAPGRSNVNIGTLNIFNAPTEAFRQRYEKHYHPRHKHGWKHLLADIFGVLIILALVIFIGFVFLGYNKGLFGRLVDLQVKISPDLLISGEQATLKFQYQNQSEQLLRQAVLAVELPSGFLIKKSPSEFSQNTNSILLGDLAPGAKSEIEISGQMIAQVGSQFKPVATLSFEPTRFAFLSTNKVVARPAFTVADTALKLTVEAPEEVSDQSEFELKIKYENTSSIEIEEVIIESKLSAPILIEKLAAGEKGEKILLIKMSAGGKTEQAILAKAFFKLNGQSLFQIEAKKSIKIFYPKLKLELVPDRNAASLGERINYLIRYENFEDFEVKNLAIAGELDTDFFDLNKTAAVKGKTVQRFVHWDSSNVPALASLKKGEKGELSFSAVLKSLVPLVANSKSALIKLTAKYNMEGSEKLYQIFSQGGVKINSNLSLRLEARYFTEEGEQLGRGPLPPRVGKETRYWIFASVSNSINPVRGVVVRLRLPSNVSWTGKATAAAGAGWQLNPLSDEIVWQIGDIGTEFRSISGGIEVALIPTVGQVATEPLLISGASVSGVDLFTDQGLERPANRVSTKLLDFRLQGKSVVTQ